MELVSEYMQNLDHPLSETVEALRQIILNTDQEIAEQIKWNSLSFYYTGAMKPFDPKEYKRDLVVLHLRSGDHVLLVFPTGAKIKDASGLLEGNFTDGRRVAKITDDKDLISKEKSLRKIIREWLKLVDR